MIFEYAISPGLFNSDDRIALLIASLGMDQGRLVSDYPKDQWEQYVIAIIKKYAQGDVQLKAWKECIFSLKKRATIVRRSNATWDQSKNWSENAVEEHKRAHFKAIVDEKENPGCAEVLQMGVPLVTSGLWITAGDQHVNRNAGDIIGQALSLLDLSGTIILVDRNFSIDGRFTNVLSYLAKYVANGKKGPKVEQIKYVASDAVYQAAEFEQRCKDVLPALLAEGISVKFIIKQKSKLHDRFIITERGALDYGVGLDEGNGHVLVKRLSYSSWEKEWNEWDKDVYHSFIVHGVAKQV